MHVYLSLTGFGYRSRTKAEAHSTHSTLYPHKKPFLSPKFCLMNIETDWTILYEWRDNAWLKELFGIQHLRGNIDRGRHFPRSNQTPMGALRHLLGVFGGWLAIVRKSWRKL